MTLAEVLNDAAQVFGYANAAAAPQAVKDRALIDINAAIQLMESGGEDFFAREELAIDLATDTEKYALAKNVQSVLAPVTLDDGTPLRELTSRGQLLQYPQLFADSLLTTVPSGKPAAYYVETLRDAADTTGDSVAVAIHLRPAPSSAWQGSGKLVLQVIKEPATVTAAALATGTAVLEVPHKYLESIFLPLMRRNLAQSYLFYDKDKLPGIEADYERALDLLGRSDPRRPKLEQGDMTPLRAGPAANAATGGARRE